MEIRWQQLNATAGLTATEISLLESVRLAIVVKMATFTAASTSSSTSLTFTTMKASYSTAATTVTAALKSYTPVAVTSPKATASPVVAPVTAPLKIAFATTIGSPSSTKKIRALQPVTFTSTKASFQPVVDTTTRAFSTPRPMITSSPQISAPFVVKNAPVTSSSPSPRTSETVISTSTMRSITRVPPATGKYFVSFSSTVRPMTSVTLPTVALAITSRNSRVMPTSLSRRPKFATTASTVSSVTTFAPVLLKAQSKTVVPLNTVTVTPAVFYSVSLAPFRSEVKSKTIRAKLPAVQANVSAKSTLQSVNVSLTHNVVRPVNVIQKTSVRPDTTTLRGKSTSRLGFSTNSPSLYTQQSLPRHTSARLRRSLCFKDVNSCPGKHGKRCPLLVLVFWRHLRRVSTVSHRLRLVTVQEKKSIGCFAGFRPSMRRENTKLSASTKREQNAAKTFGKRNGVRAPPHSG